MLSARTTLNISVILGLLVGALLVHPAPARASEMSVLVDVRHPASDVPGAQVNLGAANADEQSWGYDGQMLRVTMTLPTSPTLTGILAPGNVYTNSTAMIPIWDTAVMEAAKHEVMAGGSVQGVVVARNYAGSSPQTSPELLVDFPAGEAPPVSPTRMPDDQVAVAVRGALPPWAVAGTIQVVDDAAQERVVSLRLSTLPGTLRVIDPGEALLSLLESQQQFAPDGADIGRVTVQITDLLTGDPLYTAGGDAYLGFVATWSSPLIQGFQGPLT